MSNSFQETEKAKVAAWNEKSLILLSGSVLALSVGFVPLRPNDKLSLQNSTCVSLDVTKELSHWAEVNLILDLGCIDMLEYHLKLLILCVGFYTLIDYNSCILSLAIRAITYCQKL